MSSAKQIVCFRGDTLPGIAKDDPLPTEFRIAPWAMVKTRKGSVGCGPLTEQLLMENQIQAKRYPRIKLDLEHASVEKSPTFNPATPNAAEGDLVMRPGDGLYMANVVWTPEGEALVRGGSKNGISPAVAQAKDGQIIFVHSAGLCNHAEIGGLTLFSAGAELDLITFTAPTDTMDIAALIKLANLFILAAGLPAVPDTATADEVNTAATAAAEKIQSAMKQGVDMMTCSADIGTLKTEIAQLKQMRIADQKKVILDGAVRDGKIVAFTAEQIEGMDLTTFSAHVEKLEAGKVPMEKRTLSGIQTFSASLPEEGVKAVCKSLGLSDEDFAKYGPKN
jgi:phage I-like protein